MRRSFQSVARMASRSPSSKMRALVAPAYVTPDKYEIVEVPKPEIKGPRDVLVQVQAASVNPHDIKQARGLMKLAEKLEFPLIIGKDLSGVVTAVGSSVSKFNVGDAVFGMHPLENLGVGAVCEYAVIQEEELELKPSNLSHAEAASLPLVLYTGTNILLKADAVLKGGLKGKTALILAGLSGTGSITTQLAKHVYGVSKVITTVSTSKVPLVPKLVGDGTVDQIIDYKTQDIHKEVPPASVDFVFDTPGIMPSLIPFVKPSGAILSIAGIPAREGTLKEFPHVPPWMLFLLDIANWYYRWKLSGKQIYHEFMYVAHNNGMLKEVESWVQEKKLKPVVGKIVNFDDLGAIRDGCTEIHKGTGGVGKFVIQILPEDIK